MTDQTKPRALHLPHHETRRLHSLRRAAPGRQGGEHPRCQAPRRSRARRERHMPQLRRSCRTRLPRGQGRVFMSTPRLRLGLAIDLRSPLRVSLPGSPSPVVKRLKRSPRSRSPHTRGTPPKKRPTDASSSGIGWWRSSRASSAAEGSRSPPAASGRGRGRGSGSRSGVAGRGRGRVALVFSRHAPSLDRDPGQGHALALAAADLEANLGVHALAVRKRRSPFLPPRTRPGSVPRSVLADVKARAATRAFDLLRSPLTPTAARSAGPLRGSLHRGS